MIASSHDAVARAKAHLSAGRVAWAADELARAIETNPADAEALHLLGVVTFQLGRADEAERLIAAAVAHAPDFADAWANLATVRLALGLAAAAEAAQHRALELAPGNAVLHFNLGNLLAGSGRRADAIVAYRRAVGLAPTFADAWSNLGTALRDEDRLDDAIAAYRSAVEHAPDHTDARYNLANALRDAGDLSGAEREIRGVLSLKPDYAKAHNSLGNILSDMGRSAEAYDAFAEAVGLEPGWMPAASNLLSCAQYLPGGDAQTLARDHRRWADVHGVAAAPPAADFARIVRDPERRLTVGFVSPDFGVHPVGYLSAALFDHLDSTLIDPVIFSTRPAVREDALSRRIAAQTEWLPVDGLSDDELAERIVARRVDVLFDMSGHTSGHRLRVFARRPAPLQISWLGYVGTTGLPAMDYVLCDSVHAPIGEICHGPERPLRLENGYVCYSPPADAPDVGPLPADRAGHVTFGCLNNPAKLNDEVIASFARILTDVRSSRLVLRFKGLEDPGVAGRIAAAFQRHGIDAARLSILGRAPHREFLATYNGIDLALDTFPYSGGLTTCEALWMGVPVATFPGATFAGRHAASHMTAAGLPQFISSDRTAFEASAVAWAGRIRELASVRADLRARLHAAPLTDGPRFAADFARTVRTAWRAWCANGAAS
ncbi:MAG: tetratricopeptide repeat protein [Rhodospirillaceae bacterium]|nr:tetratricopeptide repeat protein [Rhodospirillaceae bacterium]